MSDITKLHAANIGTVGMVLSTPAKHLENIKGFSEAKVQKLIDCCKKDLGWWLPVDNAFLKLRAEQVTW